jgi:hypothetical protein
VPLRPVEAAKRLIQDHQPDPWAHERAPEAHPLPFPARPQPAPLTKHSCQLPTFIRHYRR